MVVGGNGSGKSTLVKLLTRMCEPSTPPPSSPDVKENTVASTNSLLIDGHPASSYTISSLRQATALLSQDSVLFPLPLHENIGLGLHESVLDMEMVHDAAAKGGASEIIEKMHNGYKTTLDPQIEAVELNTWGLDNDHPLKVKINEIDRKVEVSGGEKQRIVA